MFSSVTTLKIMKIIIATITNRTFDQVVQFFQNIKDLNIFVKKPVRLLTIFDKLIFRLDIYNTQPLDLL